MLQIIAKNNPSWKQNEILTLYHFSYTSTYLYTLYTYKGDFSTSLMTMFNGLLLAL